MGVQRTLRPVGAACKSGSTACGRCRKRQRKRGRDGKGGPCRRTSWSKLIQIYLAAGKQERISPSLRSLHINISINGQRNQRSMGRAKAQLPMIHTKAVELGGPFSRGANYAAPRGTNCARRPRAKMRSCCHAYVRLRSQLSHTRLCSWLSQLSSGLCINIFPRSLCNTAPLAPFGRCYVWPSSLSADALMCMSRWRWPQKERIQRAPAAKVDCRKRKEFFRLHQKHMCGVMSLFC